MIIYKDIFTDEELFTDAYPIEDFMGCFYKVTGKTVTRSDSAIDDSLIGGNASAEDQAEGCEDSSAVTGCNICLDNRLVNLPQYDKKGAGAYLKSYMKNLRKKHKEDGKEAEFLKCMPELEAGAKYLMKNIKDFECFVSPKMDPEGATCFLNYEEDGVTPYMLAFKQGIVAEKA